MFSFLLGKKEENTFKSLWEKINKNIKNKKEISELNENFQSFYKLIKEKLKFSNKSQNLSINISTDSTNNELSFIKENNILTEITKFAYCYPDSCPITLEYLSSFLNTLKFQKFIFEENTNLFIALKKLVLILKKELEQKGYKFNLKNQFSYLLNSIIRLILNYPKYIEYFIIKIKNSFSNEEYNDYIVFSSLLELLEIDQMINNYMYKKYIRRSLIVSLSLDEKNKGSYLKDSFIVEILINKLCIYYQMLPEYFLIDKNIKSLEPSVNMNINKSCFLSIYFEYKDYIIFLNKIINCFTNEQIKNKIQNYFFNKFLIENVLPNLLTHNITILRTHLQYLITLLNLSKNNANIIIVNTLSYFLLGINDTINSMNDNTIDNNDNNPNDINQSINLKEEAIYSNYLLSDFKPEKIKNILLANIHKKADFINVVIYELFNIFFQKKPYLMMKIFIKPYVDYVINNSNNKTKFILSNNTAYSMSNKLVELLNKIRKIIIFKIYIKN